MQEQSFDFNIKFTGIIIGWAENEIRGDDIGMLQQLPDHGGWYVSAQKQDNAWQWIYKVPLCMRLQESGNGKNS